MTKIIKVTGTDAEYEIKALYSLIIRYCDFEGCLFDSPF